ncbi:MAG: AMP-binding protein, partial [Caldilineales bacterium]|nr:AMP-binding protein [Caldilineales bacterium]
MTPVQVRAERDLGDDQPPFDDLDPASLFLKRWQGVVAQCTATGGDDADHPAVLAEAGSLTYGELDRLSSLWAETIAAGGFRLATTADEPPFVAVLCDQSIETIVAALACLKAGACYLPLDAHAPMALLFDLLERTHPGCLLTPSHLSELAGDLAHRKRLPLLTVDHRFARQLPGETTLAQKAMNPDREGSSRAAALLFTSGSAGQPKGMLTTYRRLLCSVWYARHDYGFGPGDRVSHLFNLSAGGSLSDVYGALLNGATLCPFDVRSRDLGAIADWLQRRRITLFHPPVTLFRELVDAYPDPERYASVRLLVLAGQTIRHDDLARFRRLFPPDCRLVNRLALSEAGLVAQMFIDHTTPVTTATVPVGYAVAGVTLLPYEDGHFLPRPTTEPVTAEIAIHSPSMVSGYWHQDELTAERFVPDPADSSRRFFLSGDLGRFHPDGLLEHLGRKDLMVKIRGYRVELTAVEQALRQIEGVKEAVVIAQEGKEGEKRLLAYLVPAIQPPMRVSALRQALAQTLPPAM